MQFQTVAGIIPYLRVICGCLRRKTGLRLRQWGNWKKKGRTSGPALHTVALENRCAQITVEAYLKSAACHVTNAGDTLETELCIQQMQKTALQNAVKSLR
jgi:hypothetical protein